MMLHTYETIIKTYSKLNICFTKTNVKFEYITKVQRIKKIN